VRLRGIAGGPAALALFTLLFLTALGGQPWVSRAEGEALGQARTALAFWSALPSRPVEAVRALDGTGSAPGLAHTVAGAFAALGGDSPGHLRAARLATALAGALLTLLLSVLGRSVAGRAGWVVAPALFWLAPRQLAAGLTAAPDLAAASLALATAWAYRSAAAAPVRGQRLRLALLCGVFFGLAVAVRPDAALLLPALALHAAGAALLARRAHAPPPPGLEGLEALLRGVPAPIGAMAVLGPPVALGGAPWLWSAPVGRTLSALSPHGLAPLGSLPGPLAPTVILACSAPLVLVFAWGAGALLAALRAGRALAGRGGHPAVASDDALLLALALAPLLGSALGLGRPGPGLSPVLPAIPFLCLLAARALDVATHAGWPSRPRLALALAAGTVLLPCAVVTALDGPPATAGWNVLVGGVAGAASRGFPRQDGGEGAAGVLDTLSARARPGARVLWVGVAPEAVEAWVGWGRLRGDLAVADGAATADLAVVALDGGSRDAEHRARAALRADRPVAGAYRDEVPLALVYARAGAWR
jgi:hypothetical protein